MKADDFHEKAQIKNIILFFFTFNFFMLLLLHRP